MDIIKLLRDDNEYYTGVGRNYLSNSDIGNLLYNPLEFRKVQEDNKNFMLGRYFHQYILEPEKAKRTLHLDVKVRRGKAYDEFKAEHDVTDVLLTHEKTQMETLADRLMTIKDFRDLIFESGVEYEVPAVGKLFGLEWKGKADIVGSNHIIDLKTSGDISSFKWKVNTFNYDSQAYIYSELFGKPLTFIGIDKKTKMAGMYPVKEETLQNGKDKVERAVEQYHKFFGDNPTHDINQFYFYEEV
jgi:hypothetical protein